MFVCGILLMLYCVFSVFSVLFDKCAVVCVWQCVVCGIVCLCAVGCVFDVGKYA